MKYAGMPMGMWALFAPSFRNQLTAVFGYDDDTAKDITKKQERNTEKLLPICRSLKGRPFQNESGQLRNARGVHSLHAAAPGGGQADGLLYKSHDDKDHAVVLPQERKKQVYRKGYSRHEATAALKAADRNPIRGTWSLRIPGWQRLRGTHQMRHLCADEGAGTVRPDPALCHLDYTMSEAGGVTNFVRQYTLLSGEPYCDCGYKRRK